MMVPDEKFEPWEEGKDQKVYLAFDQVINGTGGAFLAVEVPRGAVV